MDFITCLVNAVADVYLWPVATVYIPIPLFCFIQLYLRHSILVVCL